MNTFYLILQTKNELDPAQKDDTDYIYNLPLKKLIAHSYLNFITSNKHDTKDHHSKKKYIQLKSSMRDTCYQTVNALFLDSFYESQKCYFALSRFARLWKIKRAKIQIECDLCGNILNENVENSVLIYQNDALYYFSISDLINILKTSLLHTSMYFIADPQIPKNPYTNIEFSHAILFKIYWFIRKSDYKMPILLQLYYNTNFDKKQFLYKYEAVVRDIYIGDFIKTSSNNLLSIHIKRMLYDCITFVKFDFDKKFPENKYIEIMKPYLQLYLIYKYSLSQTDEKFQAFNILKYKLQKLKQFNPFLGRKMYIQKKTNNVTQEHKKPVYKRIFQSDYIPFHEILITSEIFLNNNNNNIINDEIDTIASDQDDEEENIMNEEAEIAIIVDSENDNEDGNDDDNDDDDDDDGYNSYYDRILEAATDRAANIERIRTQTHNTTPFTMNNNNGFSAVNNTSLLPTITNNDFSTLNTSLLPTAPNHLSRTNGTNDLHTLSDILNSIPTSSNNIPTVSNLFTSSSTTTNNISQNNDLLSLSNIPSMNELLNLNSSGPLTPITTNINRPLVNVNNTNYDILMNCDSGGDSDCGCASDDSSSVNRTDVSNNDHDNDIMMEYESDDNIS